MMSVGGGEYVSIIALTGTSGQLAIVSVVGCGHCGTSDADGATGGVGGGGGGGGAGGCHPGVILNGMRMLVMGGITNAGVWWKCARCGCSAAALLAMIPSMTSSLMTTVLLSSGMRPFTRRGCRGCQPGE